MSGVDRSKYVGITCEDDPALEGFMVDDDRFLFQGEGFYTFSGLVKAVNPSLCGCVKCQCYVHQQAVCALPPPLRH